MINDDYKKLLLIKFYSVPKPEPAGEVKLRVAPLLLRLLSLACARLLHYRDVAKTRHLGEGHGGASSLSPALARFSAYLMTGKDYLFHATICASKFGSVL